MKNLEGFIEYCQGQADTVIVMVTAQEAPLEEACQRDSRCRRFFEAFARVSLGTPDEQLRRQHWQKLCEDSPLPVPDEATVKGLLEIGDQTLRTPEWFVREHVKVDQSFEWSEETLEEFTKFRDNPWNTIAASMPALQQELWRAVYALRALGVPAFPRLVFAFRREAARKGIPGYSQRRVAVAEARLALEQLATDYMPVVDGRLVIDDIPQEIDDELRTEYAQCASKALPQAFPRFRWGTHWPDARLVAAAFAALLAALGDLGLHAERYNLSRAFVRRFPKDSVAWFYWGVVTYRSGNHRTAERACRKAIQLDPDAPQAYYNLGMTLGQLGRSEEEIGVYEEVVKRFGEAPELALREQVAKAHLGLALTFLLRKRFAEARAEAEEALRLDASNDPARKMIEELTEKGY